MLGNIFRKWGALEVKSLDQVELMKTAHLPVPGINDPSKYIQFIATRNKEGGWEIRSVSNLSKKDLPAIRLIAAAYNRAILRHNGYGASAPSQNALRLDTALMILRDIEEQTCLYCETGKSIEPRHHYSAALRLMPEQFREGLGEIFNARAKTSTALYPPKPGAPDNSAAPKYKHRR